MGVRFYLPDEYQLKVAATFEEVLRRLHPLLPDAWIEHVGSTAIAGAISKGDLDIFVGVSKDRFDEALRLIQSLGFSIKEGTLRTDSLCMLETSEYAIDVAIQLVEEGSEFESFVKFRDVLNATPALVGEYNQLKRDAASLSVDEYRARKSEFIAHVLRS